jgi:hypothetical protein
VEVAFLAVASQTCQHFFKIFGETTFFTKDYPPRRQAADDTERAMPGAEMPGREFQIAKE